MAFSNVYITNLKRFFFEPSVQSNDHFFAQSVHNYGFKAPNRKLLLSIDVGGSQIYKTQYLMGLYPFRCFFIFTNLWDSDTRWFLVMMLLWMVRMVCVSTRTQAT